MRRHIYGVFVVDEYFAMIMSTIYYFTTVNVRGNSKGKKELKRAKQTGQQQASGSECNLAVNRTLTTKHNLLAWNDEI